MENIQYRIENGKVAIINNKNGDFNKIHMYININNEPTNIDYNTYSKNFFNEFENKMIMSKNMQVLFDEILNKDISIEDAISNYNINTEEIGIEQYLISQNSN